MKKIVLIIVVLLVVWGCLGVGNLSPLSPFLLREVPARQASLKIYLDSKTIGAYFQGMGIKADFIDALRDTPDGIKNFLLTPIPDPPDVEYPTTKDESVVVQGVLAAYVLKAVKPFAGWTPVETMLRVGQHSNPLETITIAVLEYIQDTNKDHKIELQHPETGKAYLPGDLSIVVKEVNGEPKRVVAIMENTSVELNGQSGFWVGTVALETEADYTLNIVASYEKGSDATASATFTIASAGIPENPTPEPPGGKDKAAANAAKAKADEAYIIFMSGANNIDASLDNWDAWKTAVNSFVAIAQTAAKSPEKLSGIIGRIEGTKALMDTALQNEDSAEDLRTVAGQLQALCNTLQLAI
jgi:hypothetical protein